MPSQNGLKFSLCCLQLLTKQLKYSATLFAAYGIPEQIVMYNGPQFSAAEFAFFLKANGVKHIRTIPYHPASRALCAVVQAGPMSKSE